MRMGPLHLKHLRFGASSGADTWYLLEASSAEDPWHLEHVSGASSGERVGHAWLVDGEHALAGGFAGVSEHTHAEVGGGGGVFGL